MTEIAELESRLLTQLRSAVRQHPSIVQVSSLGPEDMLISDLIARHRLPIEVVTLDTGRLPGETYSQLAQVQRRYRPLGVKVRVVFPEAAAVEAFVDRHGIDGFYDSLDARKACCHARKVQPLARVLTGRSAWITGLRRAQSAERANIAEIEEETVSETGAPMASRSKYNPLAAWRDDEVWAYLRLHQVPVNPLHAQGYPSIGCAPCTRAVGAEEDPRSGRWWWESSSVRECGLHVGEDGRLHRARETATQEEPVS